MPNPSALAGPCRANTERLTVSQYAIANTVFLVVMAFYALTMYWTLSVATQWFAFDGKYPDEMASVYNEFMPPWLSTVQLSLQWGLIIGTPLLAVWFGWRIRKNPPRDRLNLP